jgi:hypothetical protein
MLPEARGAGAAAGGGGAPMRRGPPAPGVHWAASFAFFPLPRGRPRRFAPELGPAAAAELEESMLSGKKKQKWHWRKEVKCRRSRGGPI